MLTTIILGGITHHYVGSSLPYCNRINNVGTIHNEYVVAMTGNSKSKIGFIKGKDSACGDIFGPISSFKMIDSVDFILGGYNTNFKDFKKLDIVPFSIGSVTPVVGFDYKIDITKNLQIHNIISFGIVSHAIGLSF
jgi:hypothetical protein